MNTPLDTIDFLASSANRVQVLDAVADGPQSRDELMEAIDIARPTLGRILHEFEEREWIERTGRTYTATPLGSMVDEAISELLATMETEEHLRQVMPWFPVEAVSFDIGVLSDAEIVFPTETNTGAHIQRGIEYAQAADRFRTVSYQTAPPIVEASRIAVVEHGQRFEAVLARSLVETLLEDPTMAPMFTELLAAPTADVYTTDEELPVIFYIADDIVAFGLTEAEDLPRGIVFSDDDTVYTWATESFEAYREGAEPVGPDAVDDSELSTA